MSDEDVSAALRWRLLAAVNDAGALLCQAQASLVRDEALLKRADAVISRVRGLAEEAGVALSGPALAKTGTRPHMSLGEFAQHMGWGEKRMRTLVRDEMTEGQHFHRNGNGAHASYVIHVQEAEAFVRGFSATMSSSAATEVDELARFRARAALRQRGRP